MDVLNFDLLKHPLNWVVIFLMVLIAGLAIHLVLNFYGLAPGESK